MSWSLSHAQHHHHQALPVRAARPLAILAAPALAGALIALVEGTTVIILKAHCTMDVLAAIAVSWCALSLSVWLQGPC